MGCAGMLEGFYGSRDRHSKMNEKQKKDLVYLECSLIQGLFIEAYINSNLFKKEKRMYKIEKKPYGYKLTFGDMIKADEMKKWVDESKTALQTAPKEFGILIDMRTIKPLLNDAQVHMQEGQKLYKNKKEWPVRQLSWQMR